MNKLDTAAAGYISVFLGILSLCGVVCFKFPEVFTSQEFRAIYSVDLMRVLLFWGLVVAFFSGVASYLLNKAKTLAWIGISSATLASLLGGSNIEVKLFESSAYSFGLDWFVINILFSMIIFFPLEKTFALNKEQRILREEWRIDLTYFFISHLLVQFVFLWANTFPKIAFTWATNAGLQSSIQSMPMAVQFLIAVIVADFCQYIVHRAHHKIPILWRFHSIHHSCKTLDWLAGSRLHLVEVFITRGFVMVPLYVLGFSEGALNAYVILVGIQAVAIHANIGINFNWCRFLLATPQYHHWHHAKDDDFVDVNYAVHLPLIDILFGTFKCPKNQWPKSYGIVGAEPPTGFWKQFIYPFKVGRS
jgi:lathosterol oxidase